jgi:endonuclease/exonuclease/phosphatase family metal-dependent hydrolase
MSIRLLSAILLMAFCADHGVDAQEALSSPPRLEPAHQFVVPDPTPPPTRDFIRLVSWNIEWFPAGQRRNSKEHVERQMEAVAGILKTIDPDILMTQETRNLGALIALNNRMNRFFGFLASSHYREENTARVDDDKVQQETGLMSRLPWRWVEEIDFQAMARPGMKPTRGWLVASFEVNGFPFTIYNGHTKSNFGAVTAEERTRNYQNRLQAMFELRRDWALRGLDPKKDRIIVLGDMNTDLYAQEFADETTLRSLLAWGFRNAWHDVPLSERITCPSREGEPYPDGTLDYIFFSEAWGPQIPQARTLAEGASRRKDVYAGDEPGLASDHYPVIVDIPHSLFR